MGKRMHRSFFFFPVLFLLTFSNRAVPQGGFADLARYGIPHNLNYAFAIALGDVDGDGSPDIVAGLVSRNVLFLNSGSGRFREATPAAFNAQKGKVKAIALFDADGDGDLDIVFGTEYSHPDRLLLNDGKGGFTDATASRFPNYKDTSDGIEVGDVDGDGDPDLLFRGGPWGIHLYINDGKGFFKDETKQRLLPVHRTVQVVALGDLDGDGDLDIVLNGSNCRIFLNVGKGGYMDFSERLLPKANLGGRKMALFDADGDGDLDLFIGRYGSQSLLLFNDGKGKFTDVTSTHMPRFSYYLSDVKAGDFDGDGDIDLIIAVGGSSFSRRNRILINDGKGKFTDKTSTLFPSFEAMYTCLAVGDVDGDRDLDAVFGVYCGRAREWVNEGNGSFKDLTNGLLDSRQGTIYAALLADVDGDGDLDAAVGTTSYRTKGPMLYLNDGKGTLSGKLFAPYPTLSASTNTILAGDVNGDGKLDLFFGNASRDFLFLGDGKGGFKEVGSAALPPQKSSTLSAAMGDFDGDGDLDMVLARYDKTLFLANNGFGGFSDLTGLHLPPLSKWITGVAAGDIDGDGDLDLVLAKYKAVNQILLNDGKGKFRLAPPANLPPTADATLCVALADVDRDGDLDILFGNSNASSSYPGANRLLLNTGKGVFKEATSTGLPRDSDSTQEIHLVDLDCDGDLDILFANRGRDRICLNDGKGRFSYPPKPLLPPEELSMDPGAAAVGDLDGDGDPDLLTSTGDHSILWNLHRHLDAPRFPIRNSSYLIRAFGTPGSGLVLLCSSRYARTVAPPFGTLFLDLSAGFGLPAGTIPKERVLSLSIPVPGTPLLRGRRIFFQAFLADPSSWKASGFTNAFMDIVH